MVARLSLLAVVGMSGCSKPGAEGPIEGNPSTGIGTTDDTSDGETFDHSGGSGTNDLGSGGSGGESTGTGGAASTSGGAGGLLNSGGASIETATGGLSSSGGSDSPLVDWPSINGVQWADTAGQPIQAHGGGLLKVGQEYYWFGENRNPDGSFYAVSAYRSSDLRRWEHVHDVLTMNSSAELKPANVERPKVVFNSITKKYVMWMHWENGKDYGEARAAVASSDTVDGDYNYHGSFRPLQDSGITDHGKPGYMSRDCTLFVDDDGKGYFLSATNENYDLNLYLLSADYLSIAEKSALLFEGGHREAPAVFKRGDTYFLLTSGATGWDPNQAQYATSSSLTSGWSSMKNVGDGNTFYSQSTYVQAIEGSQETEFLYLGDRWAGAWGGPVNDSSYVWQPISFPDATTMSMSWSNHLAIDVEAGIITGTVDTFFFENKKSGLLLAVDGDPTQNSSPLVLGEMSAGGNQAWRLNYNAEGYFKLAHADGTKIIDVPDESSAPGIALTIYEDHNGDNQAFRLIDVGRGEYRVRNKKSGLYLGVRGASSSAGSTIEQQVDSAGEEQIWMLSVAP